MYTLCMRCTTNIQCLNNSCHCLNNLPTEQIMQLNAVVIVIIKIKVFVVDIGKDIQSVQKGKTNETGKI